MDSWTQPNMFPSVPQRSWFGLCNWVMFLERYSMRLWDMARLSFHFTHLCRQERNLELLQHVWLLRIKLRWSNEGAETIPCTCSCLCMLAYLLYLLKFLHLKKQVWFSIDVCEGRGPKLSESINKNCFLMEKRGSKAHPISLKPVKYWLLECF